MQTFNLVIKLRVRDCVCVAWWNGCVCVLMLVVVKLGFNKVFLCLYHDGNLATNPPAL